MADLLAVVCTIAFFAVAYGVALLCDRVIGPDVDVLPAASETSTDEPLAEVAR